MKLSYVLAVVASISSTFAAPIPVSSPSDANDLVARRARFPPSNYSGRLLIDDANGNFLGFVNKNPLDDGTYSGQTTQSYADAVLVLFQGDTNGNVENATNIEMQIYTPTRESEQYQWLASVVGNGEGNFQYLTASAVEVPAGQKATGGDNLYNSRTGANQGQQTHIWSYFPATFELKPFWVGSDGSNMEMELVVAQGRIVLTADAGAFIKTYRGDQIRLYLN